MLRRILIVAPIVLAVPLATLAAMSLLARQPPDVGKPTAKLAPCGDRSNCICSQEGGRNRIEPLALGVNLERTWNVLRQKLGTGERMRLAVEAPNYLHIEARSALFGFVDDLEFVKSDAEGVIHVRAAARSGKYDLGVNRNRVERIRRELGRMLGE